MGKTIHPIPNFNVDPAVGSDNVEVVMDNDFVGGDVKMETHVLGVWHGGVEVEIGVVDAQVRAMDVRGSVLDTSLLHGNKLFDILGCFCCQVCVGEV